jgi:hypothetical protein
LVGGRGVSQSVTRGRELLGRGELSQSVDDVGEMVGGWLWSGSVGDEEGGLVGRRRLSPCWGERVGGSSRTESVLRGRLWVGGRGVRQGEGQMVGGRLWSESVLRWMGLVGHRRVSFSVMRGEGRWVFCGGSGSVMRGRGLVGGR